MLHVEAVISGGLVPVSKRWTFDENERSAPLAGEFRRLLDASGFWSKPASDCTCLPDQEQIWLRVSDGEAARERILPAAGGDESLRALALFVSARVKWSPNAAA